MEKNSVFFWSKCVDSILVPNLSTLIIIIIVILNFSFHNLFFVVIWWKYGKFGETKYGDMARLRYVLTTINKNKCHSIIF